MAPDPEFSVTRVDDGSVYGLLLERHVGPDTDPQRAYFRFPPGAGKCSLQPTPTILRCCPHHEVPYTKRLECVLQVLADYALLADASGDMRAPRRISPLLEDYNKTASPVFKQKTAFTDFVGSYRVFEKCILARELKVNEFRGRAKVFRVCPPEGIYFPDDQFEFLQTVDQALQVHSEIEPQWFRPIGPIWPDFQHKTVSRCRALDELRRHVDDSPESVLIGESSAGKSVLARHLAFELRAEGKTPVYYFRHTPSIRVSALAAEINSVRGLVILEDVHHDPDTYCELCERVRVGTTRRLLITAWPSFKTSYLARRGKEAESRLFSIAGSSHCADVADFFAKQHAELPAFPWHDVLQLASRDLWLLACILQGWKAACGGGLPTDWPRAGVLERLAQLEDHGVDARTLLALAALSMHGTMTGEHYLINQLRIPRQDLRELVRLGQACTRVVCGNRYYGIPHRSLARIYWEHGASYRQQSDEDCVCDYARAGMPNGLQAVMGVCSVDTRKKILARLAAGGDMCRVVTCEQSLATIGRWGSVQRHVDDDVGRAIAAKFEEGRDLVGAADCIRLMSDVECGPGLTLLDYLQALSTADAIVRTHSLGGAAMLLTAIYEVEHNTKTPGSQARSLARDICEQLSIELLSQQLNGRAPVFERAVLLRNICVILDRPPTGLGALTNWDSLAQQLAVTDDLLGAALYLQALYALDTARCDVLWGMATVANRLVREYAWDLIADYLVALHRLDTALGTDAALCLCSVLDPLLVRAKPLGSQRVEDAATATLVAAVLEPRNGQEVIKKIDHAQWSAAAGGVARYVWIWADTLVFAVPGRRDAVVALTRQFPWGEFAKELGGDGRTVCIVYERLSSFDPQSAATFIAGCELTQLARYFSLGPAGIETWPRHSILRILAGRDPERARALCDLLDARAMITNIATVSDDTRSCECELLARACLMSKRMRHSVMSMTDRAVRIEIEAQMAKLQGERHDDNPDYDNPPVHLRYAMRSPVGGCSTLARSFLRRELPKF